MKQINVKGFIKRFDRQVWILFAGMIINVMGTSLVMPFLSIYMYKEMGVSQTMIGLLLFTGALLGAVGSYVGGSICDRYGRKRIFMIGLAFQIVAFLLFSLSIDAAVPYLVLLGVFCFDAIVGSLYRSVPEVMVADVVEPGMRVEAYGILRIGANLGWVIGPILGGMLALFAPYSMMFYVTAFTTFVYLLLVVFLLRDTKPKSEQAKEKIRLSDIKVVARDTPFLIYCIISFLLVIPYTQMYSLLSVYSSQYVGLNEFEVGMIFAVSGALVAVLQYPISAYIRKYRMTIALAACSLIFALGFGLVAISTFSLMIYVCVAIMTLGEMIWSPASSTLQANMSPENMRGRYFGFSGLFGSLGWAVGPLFGGLLKDSLEGNVPMTWMVIGGIFLICSLAFLWFSRIVPASMNNASMMTTQAEAAEKAA